MLLWYSEKPGAGIALLRDFRNWVAEDHQRVMAGLTCDWAAPDYRIFNVLEKVGFVERGRGSFVYYPRGAKDGSVR
jgi:hypothetical protein